jgi:small subunit ribosomal protein S20
LKLANTRQAKKRILVNEKKRTRNLAVRSKVRTLLKKAKTAVNDKAENVSEVIRSAQVEIDKAATKGIMHKNTAARKKSRLMKQYNKMTEQVAQ